MLSSNTSAVSGDTTYIEDVFSTYLYTGNGTTQTITNNIDLSTKGGLVWIKNRTGGSGDHSLYDSARGLTSWLATDTTGAQSTFQAAMNSFNTTGFSLKAGNAGGNDSTMTYASWTFRKQPKFFDVVTYTGNAVAGRTISHNLGSTPGCIIVKQTSAAGQDWMVYHRSLATNGYLLLNSTGAASTYPYLYSPTSTTFTVDSSAPVNANGATYVAYIFAHDAGGFGLTGTDNVISCGSFTATPADNALVNLGYEPQYVLVKKTSGVENWLQFDSMRGMTMGDDSLLNPNLSAAENNSAGNNYLNPDPQGFRTIGFSGTYIYIAIRRGPMKVPTDGTKVFAVSTRTGTGANVTTSTPFPVDLAHIKNRGGGASPPWFDRLRGANLTLYPTLSIAETAEGATVLPANAWDTQSGVKLGTTSSSTNASGSNFIDYYFRRAPSFFDEVCYTGDSLYAPQAHNLKAVPELIISKPRSTTGVWYVWIPNSSIGYGVLNTTAAFTSSVAAASSTTFDVVYGGTGVTYVNYLFATCPGVSKVGSYTGNGSSQTINCGFAAGARFVLIKRTDSTGDWYVWDTARGIVSGNDPYLLLNSTAAETTSTDYIDTYSAGFELSSTAPAALNASGGTYIFLAIA